MKRDFSQSVFIEPSWAEIHIFLLGFYLQQCLSTVIYFLFFTTSEAALQYKSYWTARARHSWLILATVSWMDFESPFHVQNRRLIRLSRESPVESAEREPERLWIWATKITLSLLKALISVAYTHLVPKWLHMRYGKIYEWSRSIRGIHSLIRLLEETLTYFFFSEPLKTRDLICLSKSKGEKSLLFLNCRFHGFHSNCLNIVEISSRLSGSF